MSIAPLNGPGGGLKDAEQVCRKMLAQNPGDAAALRRLADICFRQGRQEESLELITRWLNVCRWPDAGLLEVMQPLLDSIFVGKTLGQSARLRAAHDAWKAGLAQHAPAARPRVSLILALTGQDIDLAATLASVHGQTYGDFELIVAAAGGMPVPRSLLERSPFPVRLVESNDRRMSALLDHAVRHASGEFIDLLMPGDRLDRRRVERMVSAIAMAGGAWGFSGFELGAAAAYSNALIDSLNLEIGVLMENVRGYETTGFALLASIEVLPLSGNLFFSRQLFDAIGGFDKFSEAPHRDFALRALLHAEPFFVEETLLSCHPAMLEPERVRAERAGTQLALQRFMARATAGEPPANPFAPAMPAWGDHFIAKTVAWRKLHLLPADGVRRCLARAEACVKYRQQPDQEKLPGLDLVSFFSGEFGLAESARALARSCLAGGIPFGARPVELSLPQMRGDRSLDPWIVDSCRHKAVLIAVNPDSLAKALLQLTEDELEGRYRIGYWYWETERFPEQWRFALEFLDEIWVATEFVARAARQFTDKPVVKIPPPVEVPASLPFARADFGLAENRFLFLYSFDFSSYSARKNPHAVIAAFQRAFPSVHESVGMVIKSHGGSGHPEKLQALHAMIAGDPRISLIDRRMSRSELLGLQSVCDAFVSLHRAEGLGLGLAECMALGKPVIGTAYSGNLEFMNERNSCLVGYELTPLRPGDYLYDQPGVRWADPDIGQAAMHMRRLAEDREYRERLGAAGQAEIREHWSAQAAARKISRRLKELGLVR